VQKTVALDWKNAGLNFPVPAWVENYQQGNMAIQKLDDYKDSYCFVVEAENESNLDYAIAWVNNIANAAAQVGMSISTTVTGGGASGSGGTRATGKVDTQVSDNLQASIAASFDGFRKSADFWVLYRNKARTPSDYYAAMSLWIIDRKTLDIQIIANLQNILSNNEALSRAEQETYRERIDTIRERGLWALTTEPAPPAR